MARSRRSSQTSTRSINTLDQDIARLKASTLKQLGRKLSKLLDERDRRGQDRKLTRDEKRKLLHGFSPGVAPATDALDTVIAEIESDSGLSFADAFEEAGRRHPELAAHYLAESRGARLLPPWRGQHDHDSGPLAAAWTDAIQRYAAMPPERQRDTVPPELARHLLSRWQPLYYVDDDGAVTGLSGDRDLAAHWNQPRRRPAYTTAPLIRLAINPEFPAADIIAALRAVLKEVPHDARRRQPHDSDELARAIRWYYRRADGVPIDDLASEEAARVPPASGSVPLATDFDRAKKRVARAVARLDALLSAV